MTMPRVSANIAPISPIFRPQNLESPQIPSQKPDKTATMTPIRPKNAPKPCKKLSQPPPKGLSRSTFQKPTSLAQIVFPVSIPGPPDCQDRQTRGNRPQTGPATKKTTGPPHFGKGRPGLNTALTQVPVKPPLPSGTQTSGRRHQMPIRLECGCYINPDGKTTRCPAHHASVELSVAMESLHHSCPDEYDKSETSESRA